MRELKFRLIRDGKHIQGYEKWVDGVPNKDTGYWATPPQWIYSRDNVLWSNPEIFHDSKDQFTGLSDRNGAEIYEGSILKIEYNVRIGTSARGRGANAATYPINEIQTGHATVKWDGYSYVGESNLYDDYDSYFWAKSSKDRPEHRHEQIIIKSTSFSNGEVIGNIHENPELLERDNAKT